MKLVLNQITQPEQKIAFPRLGRYSLTGEICIQGKEGKGWVSITNPYNTYSGNNECIYPLNIGASITITQTLQHEETLVSL